MSELSTITAPFVLIAQVPALLLYRGLGTIALVRFPTILQLLTVPRTHHVASAISSISHNLEPVVEMKVTKEFLNRDYVRKHRYRTESKLRSGFVTLGRRKQTFKRLLYNCSLEIRKQYLKDELKAPMACKAKPAFFSKPSVNVYFGTNKSNNGGTMQRSSYGFGKGRGSIGLNPATMTIHPPLKKYAKTNGPCHQGCKRESTMEHTTRTDGLQ